MLSDKKRKKRYSKLNDLKERIQNLTPEKRRLLELLASKSSSAAHGEPAPPQQEKPLPPLAEDAEKTALTESLLTPGQEEVIPQKKSVHRFYDSVNRQLDESAFGRHSIFLNYGYVPNSNPSHAAVKPPEYLLHKNSVRLVLELIGDFPLARQHRLLDVGCGRGGTIATIRKFFEAAEIFGVDLTSKAIAFCRKTHVFPDTFFMEADAEKLPMADRSFDVVTNVESSHCYGDIEAFYKEVRRVLKPAGYFLYTDILSSEKARRLPSKLTELGFVIERQQDITSNVLLSCDEVAENHYRAYGDRNDEEVIQNFLAMPESPVYNDMKTGKTQYLIFKIRKRSNG